jgi:hypothetical protein
VPGKDRPRGDNGSTVESPSPKDGQKQRFASIPIGAAPGVEDDEDDEDADGLRDTVVERWLNESVRGRR